MHEAGLLRTLLRRSRVAHWGVHIVLFVLVVAVYASGLTPIPSRYWTVVLRLLILQSLFYPAAYLLNDFVDYEEDAAKQRKPRPNRPSLRMILVLHAAGLAATWVWFGGVILCVSALLAGIAAAYSVPPVRLKGRGLAGVAAAALVQRLPFFCILCASLGAWRPAAAFIIAFLACIGALFSLHHQWEDLAIDRVNGVRTWGARKGRLALSRAMLVARVTLVACLLAAWICASFPGAGVWNVPYRFAESLTGITALSLVLFHIRYWRRSESASSHEKLDGRRVLLVGATGGLGRELAILLIERGCRVALVARDTERLEDLAARLRGVNEGDGGSCPWWSCDIGTRSEVERTCREIVEGFGSPDIAIFAAGTGPVMDSLRFSAAKFEEAIRVNLLSTSYWLGSLLPEFIRRRSGTIVGVSSLAAVRGFPAGAAYCPGKAALSVLFECLRTDLTPLGIRVHLVESGFFESAMTAGLPYTPFKVSARRVAMDVVRGIESGRGRIRSPASARALAVFLKVLPSPLFDKWMGARHPMRRVFGQSEGG